MKRPINRLITKLTGSLRPLPGFPRAARWNSSSNSFNQFNLRHGLAMLASAVLIGAPGGAGAASSAILTVQAGQPGVQISSNLFGIFFEEINLAGDGGLYAEMVRNRSFEESGNTNNWQFIASGTASGSLSADSSLPLNASNQAAAKLIFSSGSGTVGLANNGWWGMNFQAGQTYDLSFYARCLTGFTNTLTTRLENANGSVIYAQAGTNNLATGWQRFTLSLVPNTSDPTGRLSLTMSQTGTVWLDVVSLFPRATFNSRTNGLRPDLANMLVNLQSSFMRFPG